MLCCVTKATCNTSLYVFTLWKGGNTHFRCLQPLPTLPGKPGAWTCLWGHFPVRACSSWMWNVFTCIGMLVSHLVVLFWKVVGSEMEPCSRRRAAGVGLRAYDADVVLARVLCPLFHSTKMQLALASDSHNHGVPLPCDHHCHGLCPPKLWAKINFSSCTLSMTSILLGEWEK